jgi:hypothetical protein
VDMQEIVDSKAISLIEEEKINEILLFIRQKLEKYELTLLSIYGPDYELFKKRIDLCLFSFLRLSVERQKEIYIRFSKILSERLHYLFLFTDLNISTIKRELNSFLDQLESQMGPHSFCCLV